MTELEKLKNGSLFRKNGNLWKLLYTDICLGDMTRMHGVCIAVNEDYSIDSDQKTCKFDGKDPVEFVMESSPGRNFRVFETGLPKTTAVKEFAIEPSANECGGTIYFVEVRVRKVYWSDDLSLLVRFLIREKINEYDIMNSGCATPFVE